MYFCISAEESGSCYNMAKVSVLFDAKALLGEAPFYDKTRNELLWVDIGGKSINFLELDSITNRSIMLSEAAHAAIPCANDDTKLVAVIGRNICLVNRATGEVEKLTTVEEDKPDNRFNDAKCDKLGRLWSGTMNFDPNKKLNPEDQTADFLSKEGSLYNFNGEKVTKALSGVCVSNGMGWSPDWKKMYFIDTVTDKVASFDYDESTGTLSNKTTVADFYHDSSLGHPDGMTVDCEGKLWVSGFFGASVSCWDPESGKKLAHIPIPALRVSSCCFGGPNYDKLLVTTGSMHATQAELLQYPLSGSIFVVEDLGVSGIPPQKYKGV